MGYEAPVAGAPSALPAAQGPVQPYAGYNPGSALPTGYTPTALVSQPSQAIPWAVPAALVSQASQASPLTAPVGLVSQPSQPVMQALDASAAPISQRQGARPALMPSVQPYADYEASVASAPVSLPLPGPDSELWPRLDADSKSRFWAQENPERD